MLIRADKKRLFDGSLGKEPGFSAAYSMGAADFWTFHCLQCHWLCKWSRRAPGSAALLGKTAIAPDFQVSYTLRLPDKIKLHYHRPNLTAFAAVWLSRDAPAVFLQLLEDAYLRQTRRHSQYLYRQFNGRGQGHHKALYQPKKLPQASIWSHQEYSWIFQYGYTAWTFSVGRDIPTPGAVKTTFFISLKLTLLI